MNFLSICMIAPPRGGREFLQVQDSVAFAHERRGKHRGTESRDMQSELDSTKSELISLTSECVFTRSEVASARERIASQEGELAGCQQREADLLKAKLLIQEAVEATTIRAKRAESHLRAMRESTSWRLTALLRAISSAVRKVAR